jgi:hypothetical protein
MFLAQEMPLAVHCVHEGADVDGEPAVGAVTRDSNCGNPREKPMAVLGILRLRWRVMPVFQKG